MVGAWQRYREDSSRSLRLLDAIASYRIEHTANTPGERREKGMMNGGHTKSDEA